jgi:hypothetical protein
MAHYEPHGGSRAVDDTPITGAGKQQPRCTGERNRVPRCRLGAPDDSPNDTPQPHQRSGSQPAPCRRRYRADALLKRFCAARYDRFTVEAVRLFTGRGFFHRTREGDIVEHPGHGAVMASPSFDSHPRAALSPWMSSTCSRSYIIAAMRAGAIAVVLLALLVLMVLF